MRRRLAPELCKALVAAAVPPVEFVPDRVLLVIVLVVILGRVEGAGRHDLGQLRSLQDWLLRFELKSVPGVAEVASIGGMVRQYQIVLDPERMAAYGVSQQQVAEAVRAANGETGGGVVEMAEVLRESGLGMLARVTEYDRAHLVAGQKAEVGIHAVQGKALPATIKSVAGASRRSDFSHARRVPS